MDNPLASLLLLAVFCATLSALFTALALLLPGAVGRSRLVMEQTPGRALLLGLVNVLFIFALIAGGGQLANVVIQPIAALLNILGLLLLLALAAFTAIGVSGLVELVTQRMGGQGAAGLLRSGLLLTLAALAPIAGWFVLAPLALLSGLGAAISAIIWRTSQAKS